MKMIHYMSDNKCMTGLIKEQSNGVWSMYRGLIGGAMAYCGDYESIHHAVYKMESDGWKEVERNF